MYYWQTVSWANSIVLLLAFCVSCNRESSSTRTADGPIQKRPPESAEYVNKVEQEVIDPSQESDINSFREHLNPFELNERFAKGEYFSSDVSYALEKKIATILPELIPKLEQILLLWEEKENEPGKQERFEIQRRLYLAYQNICWMYFKQNIYAEDRAMRVYPPEKSKSSSFPIAPIDDSLVIHLDEECQITRWPNEWTLSILGFYANNTSNIETQSSSFAYLYLEPLPQDEQQDGIVPFSIDALPRARFGVVLRDQRLYITDYEHGLFQIYDFRDKSNGLKFNEVENEKTR